MTDAFNGAVTNDGVSDGGSAGVVVPDSDWGQGDTRRGRLAGVGWLGLVAVALIVIVVLLLA